MDFLGIMNHAHHEYEMTYPLMLHGILVNQTIMGIVAVVLTIILSIAALVFAFLNLHMVLFMVNRRLTSMEEKIEKGNKILDDRKFPDELLGLLSTAMKLDMTKINEEQKTVMCAAPQ